MYWREYKLFHLNFFSTLHVSILASELLQWKICPWQDVQKHSHRGHWIVQASWRFTRSSTWSQPLRNLQSDEERWGRTTWRIFLREHWVPDIFLFPRWSQQVTAHITWIHLDNSLRETQLESLLEKCGMAGAAAQTFSGPASLWTVELRTVSKCHWRGWMWQVGGWNGELVRKSWFRLGVSRRN